MSADGLATLLRFVTLMLIAAPASAQYSGGDGSAENPWRIATPDDLRQRLSKGYTFVSYGSDYQLLKDAALTGIEAYHTHVGE